MTGLPNNNYDAFSKAEWRLVEKGNTTINPHAILAVFGTANDLAESYAALNGDKGDPSLARAAEDAVRAAVRSCDAIFLLKGWESSKGSKKELAEALANGLEVILED